MSTLICTIISLLHLFTTSNTHFNMFRSMLHWNAVLLVQFATTLLKWISYLIWDTIYMEYIAPTALWTSLWEINNCFKSKIICCPYLDIYIYRHKMNTGTWKITIWRKNISQIHMAQSSNKQCYVKISLKPFHIYRICTDYIKLIYSMFTKIIMSQSCCCC
jgi:hypothetical protein